MPAAAYAVESQRKRLDALKTGTSVRPPRAANRRIVIWFICLPVAAAAAVILAQFAPLAETVVGAQRPTMTIALLVFLAAVVCEYVDSSLGMGYGTTLTPVLLLSGFEPLAIVPCVLMSEFLTGLAAALLHHCDGNVDLLRDRKIRSTAAWLCCLSIVGTVAGLGLAVRVSKQWLTVITGAIVFSVGLLTLATIRRQLRYRPFHIVGLGLVAAFNKALSGGGYGPLVTAGQVVSGVPSKSAVAITSLAESFTCLLGLIGYVAMAHGIDWPLAAPMCIGALFSVPIATLTVRVMNERTLRGAVGVLTCLLGLVTLLKLL